MSFEELRAAYWSARTALMYLIENPEKHLPLDEYRAHLEAAKTAHNEAHTAMLAAWP